MANRRSGDRRRSRPPTKRHYPRTARLNTLLQEIVADHLERVEDDRLGFLTVTGVEVDADLNRAQVFISTLTDESHDAEILEALADHRKPIQADIGRSARIRKTPEVVFVFDPAVRTGARIEGILAALHEQEAEHGPPTGDEARDDDPDDHGGDDEGPAEDR